MLVRHPATSNVKMLYVMLLISLLHGNIAANILMVTMGGTRSHTVPFAALARALVARHHNVTLLSGFPGAAVGTGAEDVTATKLSEYIQHFTFDWDIVGRRSRGQMPISVSQALEYGVESCRSFLRDPDTKRFLQGRNYQLVILDGAYSACALGLAYHFSAPYMFLNTVAMYTESLATAGNPEVFAITPFVNTDYTDQMSMLARLHNAVMHLTSRILLRFFVNFFVQPELRATFGANIPDVFSMQRDVSFILQNGHATLTYPRPWLPNVAEVACIHCHPPAPLPKDLEEWVDGAGTHGVIVVSMGSSVTAVPDSVRRIFVQALSRISQRVIWKLDLQPNSTLLEILPPNVKIVRWLPQQDLLGHPGVVALVSHGGLLSMFETVYHAKPMVTLPVFCDHDANAAKAELDGYALRIELQGLTADALVTAIKRVVYDPRYRTNVELRSRQFHDQPETPLQRAVFWTEYVLRHRGAAHLKGQWQHLGVLQWFYLDVILAFSLFMTIILQLWTRYSMKIGQEKLKKH